MTPTSYAKLKRLFPTNCIDGSNEELYPLVIPKFVPDKEKFLEKAIFVDIFIVVPTTNKKVKKFRSLSKKINFSLQAIHSS
jgi:lipopolysaccharide cholinephosphotransferase